MSFNKCQFCYRSEGNGALGFDLNSMLQQFSWGYFLIAMIVLNLVWYVVVLLVFYRSELMAFFGGGFGGGIPMNNGDRAHKTQASGRSITDVKQIELEVDQALMGGSRLPDGVQVKSSSEVNFSASGSDGKYEQVGLIADVLQELKLVFFELEKKSWEKMDFFRLLERVKEQYGPLAGHPSVAALSDFIVERAPFHLTKDEIDNLWF